MLARYPGRFISRETIKVKFSAAQGRSISVRTYNNKLSHRLLNGSKASSIRGFAQPHTCLRTLSYLQTTRLNLKEASKGIWRKYPIVLPFAILSVVGATSLFVYIFYVDYWYNRPQYAKFPPAVAKPLRLAVYYTEIKLEPAKALELYKQALRIALDEERLHPYSKEVLGIKIQASAMLQKAGLLNSAIQVLEQTAKEALAWVEEGRRRSELREKQLSPRPTRDNSTTSDEDDQLQQAEAQEERLRSLTLQKVVGMQMRLGELYEQNHNRQKALESQEAAVNLCVKEMNRRQNIGLPVSANRSEAEAEEEDGWMDSKTLAFALESVAQTYQDRDMPQLAIPLYLQALDLLKDHTEHTVCHQAVIMNNISGATITSLQQHVPMSSSEKLQAVDAARQWAQKAYEISSRSVSQNADENQCHETNVSAVYNLGHIAELQERWPEAQRYYQEAKRLASDLAWSEGIKQSDEALSKLQIHLAKRDKT
jgi:tetratricopeptide (TPR) repeat protein